MALIVCVDHISKLGQQDLWNLRAAAADAAAHGQHVLC
jgi:hypothetical protein